MATPEQIRRRGRWSLVLGTLVAAATLAAVAYADQIQPDADLVVVGNQAARNLGTVAPGATLTPAVSFELQCSGNNHVNSGQSVNLTFSLSGSTVPGGGSLSATNASIGPIPAAWPDDGSNCSSVSPAPTPIQDNGNSTATITAPTTPGSYTYVVKWDKSVSPPDVTGTGPTVSFTLTVPADSTPPVITPNVSGTLGTNGWYTSDVVVSWNVVDNDSSISSSSGCGTTTLTSDTTGTTLTCTATSAGGTASQSVTVKRDATAPTISGSASPAPNANGWNDEDLTVSFTCSDLTSGVASCASPQILSTEGAGQSASGMATDNAGNTASTTVTGVNIDKTAPTANANPLPAANANGWNNTDVTVTFSGSDGISGIDSCTAPVVLSSESAGQSASGTCTDLAGNVSGTATASGINIDKNAPSASASASPPANGNGWNNTDVTVTFSGSDGLSGIASCTAPAVLSGEGAGQSASGSCTDKAGNVSGTATASGIDIDKTAPTIADLSPTTSANANGWYNADVTNRFTASDSLSGLDSDCLADYPDDGGERIQSKTTTGEGMEVSVTSDSCTDLAGNTAVAKTSAAFQIDKTAPTATATATPTANANGWNNTDVTVSFDGTDGLSGIDFCDPAVVLSSEGIGQSASGTCTDKAGNVSGTATASGIDIDKTAPAITDLGPTTSPNGNGWYNADVTNRFQASDGLSGLDSDCLAAYPASGGDRIQSKAATGEGLTVSVTSDSCTDLAGNTAAAKTSAEFQIDKTAPTITDLGPTTSPNGNGWYKDDVTNRFQASDGLSGLDSDCLAAYPASGGDRIQSKTTSGEGSAVTVTSNSCTDLAGNTDAAKTSAAFQIDQTAPTASASASPPANANGWNNTDVTVSFSGSDGLSGIDFCDPDVVLSSEGAGQSASGTCTDKAGNVSDTATASGISIDKTAPTVTWSGGPAPGSSHYFGSVPAAPTCAAVDALSGPDTCVVTGYGTTVGSHTMTATAKDKAGNTGTEQRSYTVLAWTLEGFFQPVDMGSSVWNTVKGGSTVPLKFRVFAGPTELTDTAIVTVMKAVQLGCSTGSEDAIEELAPTGGTSLRYASQFIYNWQTPKQPGKCYRVTVGTADGSFLVANFKLK